MLTTSFTVVFNGKSSLALKATLSMFSILVISARKMKATANPE